MDMGASSSHVTRKKIYKPSFPFCLKAALAEFGQKTPRCGAMPHGKSSMWKQRSSEALTSIFFFKDPMLHATRVEFQEKLACLLTMTTRKDALCPILWAY